MGVGLGSSSLLLAATPNNNNNSNGKRSSKRLPSMPLKRGKQRRYSSMPALHLGGGGVGGKPYKPVGKKAISSKLSLPKLSSPAKVDNNNDSTDNNVGGSVANGDASTRSTPKMTSSISASRSRGRHDAARRQTRADGGAPLHGGDGNDAGDVAAASKLDNTYNNHHPARRKEKINDWRDVKTKMRRRLFQTQDSASEDSKEEAGPVFRRLTPEETLRRRAMPAIELPPDYVGPVLPGERVSKALPEIGRSVGGGARLYHRQFSSLGEMSGETNDDKTTIRNFRKNCLNREPLETIKENKSAEHELETGFWQFFDEHFKI